MTATRYTLVFVRGLDLWTLQLDQSPPVSQGVLLAHKEIGDISSASKARFGKDATLRYRKGKSEKEAILREKFL